MKRWVVGCLILCLLAPINALAEPVAATSTDLIEEAKTLDGHTVVYTGEVIGDVLMRGDHAWLNLSDGKNAIGVWVAASMLQGQTLPGRYDQTGDFLTVTGAFHRACQEHGGDMDIHAELIALAQKGFQTHDAVPRWALALAIVLTVLDILIFLAYYRKKALVIRH